jgi:hypothetical protein
MTTSTYELYTTSPDTTSWELPMAGDARFSWEYAGGNARLLSLYAKGKQKQWDAATRIDWSLDVDPSDALGLPPRANALLGTRVWESMGEADRKLTRQHFASWQFSQFLHGEQGAMICSARIVEGVPGLDAKLYAATQTIDEARHVEAYARFLQEKVQLVYPINPHLKSLLDNTLSDSRWDMPYLGMQVLIEGLALAAFGLLRDLTTVDLPRQLLAYVMQDEARHVAFGRIALKEYYAQLTQAERDEREEFVVEGSYLMRDRLRGVEVWETLGLPRKECEQAVDNSEYMRAFRNLLFSRIVPCVKDIGLWGPRVQKAYADMGVLDLAGTDLDELMSRDEQIAQEIDEHKARAAQVQDVIDLGLAVG